jgi:hypothetical protein
MSDNIHPEIVELRHRVMVLEAELARTYSKYARFIDPLELRGDRTVELPSIWRFVLVTGTGRKHDETGIECALSFQDEGKTLKVFVDKRYGN